MSPYLAGGLLIAFTVWSGTMALGGYKYASYKAGEADAKRGEAQAQVTVAAEKNVIDTVQKQQTISQGVSHDYEAGVSNIDILYGSSRVQSVPSTTGDSVRTISAPTCRIDASTRKYKLTKKQCDISAARLVSLQEWIKEQQK